MKMIIYDVRIKQIMSFFYIGYTYFFLHLISIMVILLVIDSIENLLIKKSLK